MKRLFMTFAAMLLMSVSAFAQSSETPLKGDVNEDGVVDVADITAIIAIIKANAEPQTIYYWYVGAENPTTIGPIQPNAGLEGWREIGTTLNGWSFEVDNTNKIKFNDYPTTHAYYIVIPNTLHLYFADNTLAENVTFGQVSTSISGYKAWQLTDGESATAKGFIIHE